MERSSWSDPRGAALVERPLWSGPRGAPTHLLVQQVLCSHAGHARRRCRPDHVVLVERGDDDVMQYVVRCVVQYVVQCVVRCQQWQQCLKNRGVLVVPKNALQAHCSTPLSLLRPSIRPTFGPVHCQRPLSKTAVTTTVIDLVIVLVIVFVKDRCHHHCH